MPRLLINTEAGKFLSNIETKEYFMEAWEKITDKKAIFSHESELHKLIYGW